MNYFLRNKYKMWTWACWSCLISSSPSAPHSPIKCLTGHWFTSNFDTPGDSVMYNTWMLNHGMKTWTHCLYTHLHDTQVKIQLFFFFNFHFVTSWAIIWINYETDQGLNSRGFIHLIQASISSFSPTYMRYKIGNILS